VRLHREEVNSTTNIVIVNNRQPMENTFGERLDCQESMNETSQRY
jgi:hypothetical protein